MSLVDTNRLIRTYLLTPSATNNPLIALTNSQIYCPRLPENVDLLAYPAVSFFTRGGTADPDVVHISSPSVQFDCWALRYDGEPSNASIRAREVYRALFDALQGLGNAGVTIGGTTYYITKAREEVQGQDLTDVEIPNYFRVMTFYSITVRDNL